MKYIIRTFNYMVVTIKAYERSNGFFEYDYKIPVMNTGKVMKYIKKNINNNAIDFDIKEDFISETRKISVEKFLENSEVVN